MDGLTFIWFGAPTKAALLSKVTRLNENRINFTFEDNVKKINKYIPGTNIKIIGTNKINQLKPDYIVLFAWNFYLDIVKKFNKLKKKNRNLNVKLVVPLPKLKVFKI